MSSRVLDRWTRMETMIEANGVALCVETFGARDAPAVLLIHGASASMLWWEEELCERIAADGRFVIRFDHRDTGRSVSYPAGRPGYSLRDMAGDAVGILDSLAIERAHLVGRSMGGGIALLADPARVASLVLLTTGDRAPKPIAIPRPPEDPDPDRVVEFIVELMRAYAGGSPYFDEARMRALAQRDMARTRDVAACLTNHFVIDTSGEPNLGAPALIVAGALDPLFPPDPHGLALQAAIPGSELRVLERTGHDLPPQTWEELTRCLSAFWRRLI
jgi:pimeloyl-ACP methyl ester carboxylesterase